MYWCSVLKSVMYQRAPNLLGADTMEMCLILLLLCLTVPCMRHQKSCLSLFCVSRPCYSSEFLFFSSTAPLTAARLVLFAWSHHCSRGKELSRAELLDAREWSEVVGPARKADCMGSIFQREWREEEDFKVAGILMLQLAIWFRGLFLLSLARCTTSPIVIKTEWYDNSLPSTAPQNQRSFAPRP